MEIYVEVRDIDGNILEYYTPKSFISLITTRSLNTVGETTILFNYDTNILKLFNRDIIIGIYRIVKDDYYKLEGDTLWFVRKITSNPPNNIQITCKDAISLLERRTIAYNSGNSYTHKLDYADNIAKALVRENYGSLCLDTRRDLSAWIYVEPNVGQCSNVRMEFTRDTLLKSITSASDTSNQYGIPMYFDMLYNADRNGFTFRTWANLRGADLSVNSDSKNKIILGVDYNNVSEVKYEKDYTDEYNYVYCSGTGVGDILSVASAYDSISMYKSPYNRVEEYTTGASSASAEELINEAKDLLKKGSARITYEAKILDYIGSIFGYDYNFGDKVTIQNESDIYDVIVNSYSIKVSEGVEEITVQLKYEENKQIESEITDIVIPEEPEE